jgi:hypothetical protein
VTGLLAVAAALALAAVLARGRLRPLALSLAVAGLAIPFWLRADAAVVRFLQALLAAWGLVRVIDLCRDAGFPSWRARLWHVFAAFDTRRIERVPPRRDRRLYGLIAVHLLLGTAGLGLVVVAPLLGYLHTAVRWVGGAAFVYGTAGVAAELVRALYLLIGIAVPPVHDAPVRARSLGEFWGRRWNRVVSSWLRQSFFAPLARRGHAGAGLLLAFTASAVLHGYTAVAAGGPALALPMTGFFLVQGLLSLAERRLEVDRWPPGQARVWFWAAMLSSGPLFLEPILAIFLPAVP